MGQHASFGEDLLGDEGGDEQAVDTDRPGTQPVCDSNLLRGGGDVLDIVENDARALAAQFQLKGCG
ncbi:hypothetical protein [Streptomyces avermitilis]|uniref:hypothetical protein n=1 Tax=Streptomyces avermitilis TaxID=33903 RepID=UPI0033A79C9E